MALFVYLTDNCLSDARDHGLTSELERFRDRVESTQSTSLFDPFPPPYLVKKKLGGRQGRLIADLRPVGDHAVVVFLAVLIRGSRAYEDEFASDPITYGKQHFNDLLDIDRFVEERTRTQPVPIRPDPTAPEYGLLYGAFAHHRNSVADDLVCETKEWVEQITQERISKQLALFCEPCLSALKLGQGLHFISVSSKQGWGVWALRIEGRLLLITLATETTSSKAEEFARKTAAELDGKDAITVLRSSRRVYPALILADDELWIDLEKEPVANMALSPEESEVLESARHSENPFPLFINGRAGSGKSTILQYLFADLLFFYLSGATAQEMAPPIYLTVNGELLRVARSFVERLLRSEAIFSQQSGADLALVHKDILDDAFRQFQPHLLSLVPSEDRARLFGRAARVDYTRFRRMWMDRFGKDRPALREFGPDLSWHVIRSYIKGMSSETYLEPEDYRQLPENQITVTHDAFKQVHERVWLGWYQGILEDQKLWDDQDLTRHVLESDLARPTYPAVVCDEAQDFTRLELELLLRLNLFSSRTLRPNDVRRVPFAFAGDQFQTLNPTGFRWDSIKASFVEKFIFELDPSRRSGHVELNYRELKYNYRSTYKIVRFGNHIQALRAALFGLPDLKPQTPWTIEQQSLPVVWFRANNSAFWKKFRDSPGFVVIVPCSEGEEADFVEQDPILREHIKSEDGVPINVLSAARAKGCEYPAVIVYGFGTAANIDILSELRSESSPSRSDPDKSLPIQYFVNRLYVAVSRPKRRLVIVDSDQGFERLWKCAQEEAAESVMLEKVKNGRLLWGPQIEGMTIGDPDDLALESAGDPLENAKAFESDGRARQDAFLLKQAAQAYRSGGDVTKAKECRARAFEAEGIFYDAGEAYFDAGFSVPDGVRCLWRAGKQGWARLCDRLSQNAQIRQEIEFQWARVIIGKSKPAEVADLLGRFAQRLEDVGFAGRCIGEPIWREALDSTLQPLVDPKHPPYVADELWNSLVASLDRIRASGVAIPTNVCAQIYFSAKRYRDAVELWDKSGETKPTAYHKAKATVEPYPENIMSLSSLGLVNEIVQAYSAAPGAALSSEQATIVVDALRESKRLDDAYDLAWSAASAAPMLRLVPSALHKGDKVAASRALHAGIILLIKKEMWDLVTGFASSLEFAPAPEWKEQKFRGWVKSEADAMQVTLVRALARSEALPNAPKNVQRRLSDFLRQYLRGKEGRWRSQLSLAEAGAAVERGGRFTDAIAFYEAVANEEFSKDDKAFAARRWLVNKQRQADYEKSQGDPRKATQIEHDLKQEMVALRITALDELGQFPKLVPLEMLPMQRSGKPAATLGDVKTIVSADNQLESQPAKGPASDQIVMSVGSFRLEFSRTIHRCNITHAETMATAFVKTNEKRCGGEVDFKEINAMRWVCEAWRVTVQFPQMPTEPLVIDLEEPGVQLRLQQ
jgi:tetratricopeptide (TPR) repeat protein